MRLDVFLARTRLVMPRQKAKRACDNGIVSVNGHTAKPATTVREGDSIAMSFTDQDLTVRVVGMPSRAVRKGDAEAHYEVIEDRRIF